MKVFNEYLTAVKDGAHIGYLVSGLYETFHPLLDAAHAQVPTDVHTLTFTVYALMSLLTVVRGKGRDNNRK